MTDDPFWKEQCLERAPGLTHTRDAGGWNKCNDCGIVPPPLGASAPVVALGMSLTEASQVKRRDEPDPMTGCVLDHASIDTKTLIGDDGLSWTRCPFCNAQVEPAMRTGTVIGPVTGPGRGDMTDRLKGRLQKWAGWVDFNGGR